MKRVHGRTCCKSVAVTSPAAKIWSCYSTRPTKSAENWRGQAHRNLVDKAFMAVFRKNSRAQLAPQDSDAVMRLTATTTAMRHHADGPLRLMLSRPCWGNGYPAIDTR